MSESLEQRALQIANTIAYGDPGLSRDEMVVEFARRLTAGQGAKDALSAAQAQIAALEAKLEEAEQNEKELRRIIDRGRDSNATELGLAAQLAEQRNGNIALLERAETAEAARAKCFEETRERAAKIIRKVLEGIYEEHSNYDPDTGATEISNPIIEGRANELEELEEAIRAMQKDPLAPANAWPFEAGKPRA